MSRMFRVGNAPCARFVFFCLVVALCPHLTRWTDAATYSWTAGSANWDAGGNWNPAGGPPDSATDSAIFDAQASATQVRLFGGSRIVGNLTVSSPNPYTIYNPNGDLTPTGKGLTLSQGSFTHVFDQNGAGQVILNVPLTLAGGTTVWGGTGTGQVSVNGVISGSQGITKTGSYALALNNANTFTGVIKVSAGSVQVSADNNLGNAANALALDGGTLQTTSSFTTARGITLSANNGIIDVANGTTVTATGIISSVGSLTKAAGTTGTLLLAGANTFSGGLIINGGSVQAGAVNTLGTGALTLSAGSTLNLSGFSQTVGSLSGADGTVTTANSAGVATLAAGNDNTSTSFGGVLQDNGSGQIALSKQGSGTMVLSGSSTYSGVTTVSAGALNIQNGSALGSATGKTVVNSGAALQLQGGIAVGSEPLSIAGTGTSNNGVLRNISGNNSWNGSVTLTGSATIASDANTLTVNGAIPNGGFLLTVGGAQQVTLGGVISGAGGLTKTGAGTLTLNGSSSFTGNITVSQGTLLLGASQRIASGTALNLNGGTFATGGFNQTLGTLTLSANSIIDLGAGASVLAFGNSSASAWTGSTTLQIQNWSGSNNGGGTDQLIFGNQSTGLTVGQIAEIRFVNPSAYPAGTYSARILNNGEVVPVPVPEPGPILGLILIGGLLVSREKRLLKRLIASRRFLNAESVESKARLERIAS